MDLSLVGKFYMDGSGMMVLCRGLRVLLVYSLILAANAVSGQTDTVTSGDANAAISSVVTSGTTIDIPTVEDLETQRKKLVDSDQIVGELKNRLIEVYDQAITARKTAAEYRARQKSYEQRRQNAPTELEEARTLLSKPTEEPQVGLTGDVGLAQLDQALTEAKLVQKAARDKVLEWEEEPKRRAERRARIPEELNQAREALNQIEVALVQPSEDDTSELSQAQRLLLRIKQRIEQNRLEAGTTEVLYYDASSDLLAVQRDLARRRAATADKQVEWLQNQINLKRKMEAQQVQQEAQATSQALQAAYPEVKALASENTLLAQKQSELAVNIEAASRAIQILDQQLAELDKDFAMLRSRIDMTKGITGVVEVMLLSKRNSLPDTYPNRRNIKYRQQDLTEVQLAWSKYDQQWYELADIQPQQEALIERLVTVTDDNERNRVRTLIQTLLTTRRSMLKRITELYLEYTTYLADWDARERRLVQTVDQSRRFIDENILWVRSDGIPRMDDLRSGGQALIWLTAMSSWQGIFQWFYQDLLHRPGLYGLLVLVVTLLFVLHRRVHGMVNELAQKMSRVTSYHPIDAVRILWLSVFLAAPWPVLGFFAYWRLHEADATFFARTLALGVQNVSALLFTACFLHHLLIPGGLAQIFFNIRPEALSQLRSYLVKFFLAMMVPVFLVRIMQVQEVNPDWSNSLGRLAFVMELLVFSVFLGFLLNPSGQVLGPYLSRYPDRWMTRLRYIWYPLGFVSPFGFAILAVWGYFYGALHLYERFVYTIALIVCGLFVHRMFMQWIRIIQTRILLRERQKKATQQGSNVAGTGESGLDTQERPQDVIINISQQTQRLVRAASLLLMIIGIGFIWRSVLPALSYLDNVHLWTTTNAQGESIYISLRSVVLTVAIMIMTIVVTRNVPGLLEMAILQKLPLDRGVRFAITTLCRYILAVVGVILAFTEIGIGWSKIQWLIAAMTVGLGFGLQEIFANFVSGLIILFEQPIRVDDVVTVGDITGTVTRIRIRATTIRKWDQRELIVPNKEFITTHLVNWTLTDNIIRVDFPVGIAYGSDIKKAEQCLRDIATQHRLVLKNPESLVIFTGFGDSSLSFELRIFIAGMDDYLQIWHEINCAIDTRFREEKIEIAFPQRDLHIRSVRVPFPVELPQE